MTISIMELKRILFFTILTIIELMISTTSAQSRQLACPGEVYFSVSSFVDRQSREFFFFALASNVNDCVQRCFVSEFCFSAVFSPDAKSNHTCLLSYQSTYGCTQRQLITDYKDNTREVLIECIRCPAAGDFLTPVPLPPIGDLNGGVSPTPVLGEADDRSSLTTVVVPPQPFKASLLPTSITVPPASASPSASASLPLVSTQEPSFAAVFEFTSVAPSFNATSLVLLSNSNSTIDRNSSSLFIKSNWIQNSSAAATATTTISSLNSQSVNASSPTIVLSQTFSTTSASVPTAEVSATTAKPEAFTSSHVAAVTRGLEEIAQTNDEPVDHELSSTGTGASLIDLAPESAVKACPDDMTFQVEIPSVSNKYSLQFDEHVTVDSVGECARLCYSRLNCQEAGFVPIGESSEAGACIFIANADLVCSASSKHYSNYTTSVAITVHCIQCEDEKASAAENVIDFRAVENVSNSSTSILVSEDFSNFSSPNFTDANTTIVSVTAGNTQVGFINGSLQNVSSAALNISITNATALSPNAFSSTLPTLGPFVPMTTTAFAKNSSAQFSNLSLVHSTSSAEVTNRTDSLLTTALFQDGSISFDNGSSNASIPSTSNTMPTPPPFGQGLFFHHDTSSTVASGVIGNVTSSNNHTELTANFTNSPARDSTELRGITAEDAKKPLGFGPLPVIQTSEAERQNNPWATEQLFNNTILAFSGTSANISSDSSEQKQTSSNFSSTAASKPSKTSSSASIEHLSSTVQKQLTGSFSSITASTGLPAVTSGERTIFHGVSALFSSSSASTTRQPFNSTPSTLFGVAHKSIQSLSTVQPFSSVAISTVHTPALAAAIETVSSSAKISTSALPAQPYSSTVSPSPSVVSKSLTSIASLVSTPATDSSESGTLLSRISSLTQAASSTVSTSAASTSTSTPTSIRGSFETSVSTPVSGEAFTTTQASEVRPGSRICDGVVLFQVSFNKTDRIYFHQADVEGGPEECAKACYQRPECQEVGFLPGIADLDGSVETGTCLFSKYVSEKCDADSEPFREFDRSLPVAINCITCQPKHQDNESTVIATTQSFSNSAQTTTATTVLRTIAASGISSGSSKSASREFIGPTSTSISISSTSHSSTTTSLHLADAVSSTSAISRVDDSSCSGLMEFLAIPADHKDISQSIVAQSLVDSAEDCARLCYGQPNCIAAGFLPKTEASPRAICFPANETNSVVCPSGKERTGSYNGTTPVYLQCLKCNLRL